MGKLPYRCDVECDFDNYEYQTTEGPRKYWDGEPDLSKEGWEEWADWERFDYTEERYWRRPLSEEQRTRIAGAKAVIERSKARLEKERKVIEAAKALVHGWSFTDPQTGQEWQIKPYAPYSKDRLEERLRALEAEEE